MDNFKSYLSKKLGRRGIDPLNPTLKLRADGSELDQGIGMYTLRVIMFTLALIILIFLMVTPSVTGLMQVLIPPRIQTDDPAIGLITSAILGPIYDTKKLLDEDTAPRVRSIQTAAELRIPGLIQASTQQILSEIQDRCKPSDGSGGGDPGTCPSAGEVDTHHKDITTHDPDTFVYCEGKTVTIDGGPALNITPVNTPEVNLPSIVRGVRSLSISPRYLGFVLSSFADLVTPAERSLITIGLGQIKYSPDGFLIPGFSEISTVSFNTQIGHVSSATTDHGVFAFFRLTTREDAGDAKDLGVRDHAMVIMRPNREVEKYTFSGGEIQGGSNFKLVSTLRGNGRVSGDSLFFYGYGIPATEYGSDVFCPYDQHADASKTRCNDVAKQTKLVINGTGYQVFMMQYEINGISKKGIKPTVSITMMDPGSWPIPGPYKLTEGRISTTIVVDSWGWYGTAIFGVIKNGSLALEGTRRMTAYGHLMIPDDDGLCYQGIGKFLSRSCTINSIRYTVLKSISNTQKIRASMSGYPQDSTERIVPIFGLAGPTALTPDQEFPAITSIWPAGLFMDEVEHDIECFGLAGEPVCISTATGSLRSWGYHLSKTTLGKLRTRC